MSIENEKLNRTFAALADPTRPAIFARSASGEASPQDLAMPFKMTLPAVSKHLKVLERAKLTAEQGPHNGGPVNLIRSH